MCHELDMTTIEKIDEDLEKERDLTIIENSLNQAIHTQDYEQAKDLINKGISIARSIQHEKWMALFQGLLLEVESQLSDNFINKCENAGQKSSESEVVIEKIEPDVEINHNLPVAKVVKGTEDISNLNGIGSKTATLLIKAGITSIELLALKNPKELCVIKGIAEKSAEKYIRQAKEYMKQNRLTSYVPDNTIDGNEDEEDLRGEDSVAIEEESQNLSNEVEFFNNADMHSGKGVEEEFFQMLEEGLESNIYEEKIPDFNVTLPEENIAPSERNSNKEILSHNSQTTVEKHSKLIDGEEMELNQFSDLIIRLEKKARSSGFYLLPAKNLKYEVFFQLIDIIAIKIEKITDLLELVLIVPIKVSSAKGRITISEMDTHYAPVGDKNTINSYKENILVSSGFKALKVAQRRLHKNIVEKGSVLSFLSNYIRRKVSIEKSFTKNRMFLNSEGIQMAVVIAPILITDGKIGFLESTSV
ncbi:MAG: helix-hairpin-helix domain-containing protein, partial [Promethearchaeota archaeon]